MEETESHDIFEKLEDVFLEDLEKNQTTMIIARKGSGKSFFTNKLILYALKNDLFKEIWIIAPSFSIDRAGTYLWLEEQKFNKNTKIFVYGKFSHYIIEKLREAISKEEPYGREYIQPRLLIMDDFTTYADISEDETFLDIMFESRHYRVSIVGVAHSLKLRNAKTRQNIENYVLARIGNRTLLESIWEELLSTWIDKKEFFSIYNKEMKSRDYPLVLINNAKGKIDPHTDEYFKGEHSFILSHIKKMEKMSKITKPLPKQKPATKDKLPRKNPVNQYREYNKNNNNINGFRNDKKSYGI